MHDRLKVLLVEDNPGDAVLIREMLVEGMPSPCDLAQATDLSEGLAHLATAKVDVILLDLSLPDSRGLDTLDRVQVEVPQVPIVVLTGLDDEEMAVRAVRQGAQDYLVKGTVDYTLLVRAIRYAIERKRVEVERERLLHELTQALAQVRTLQGLLPICSSCKKIRDDQGYWQAIEGYLHDHAEIEFSHGLCPECAHRLYPEYFEKDGQ